MINQIIVDILVRRIKEGGLNPKTGQPMKLDDIKSDEYREAVFNHIDAYITDQGKEDLITT